jgi:hypothetical protein
MQHDKNDRCRRSITCFIAINNRADEVACNRLEVTSAALGKAAAENIVIDEVLPEIKRRR